MQHPPHHHLVSTFYIFRHTHKLLSILSTSPKKRKERSSCSDTFHWWAVTTTATSQYKVQRGKKLSVPRENNLSFARYSYVSSKCSVHAQNAPQTLYFAKSIQPNFSIGCYTVKKGRKKYAFFRRHVICRAFVQRLTIAHLWKHSDYQAKSTQYLSNTGAQTHLIKAKLHILESCKY